MRPALVVANWKMHGDRQFIRAFASQYGDAPAGVDVVVCPPLAYLAQCVSTFRGVHLRFGAQDVAAAPSGAFTGEHAAEMARDIGAEYAIVGHSERRRLFGESDALVAEKFQAARRAGLHPILCVGETLGQRQRGEAVATVAAQLAVVLAHAGASAFENATVAYEPVWAIGTGETATPALAQEMHAAIRAQLRSAGAGAQSRLLYGGSVTADGAAALFAAADIDGGLVGGASLDAAAFKAVCCAAATGGRRTLQVERGHA